MPNPNLLDPKALLHPPKKGQGSNGGQNRRVNHRVAYPNHVQHLRPQIRFAGSSLKVLDISKNGIRFQTPRDYTPAKGQRIAAYVDFHQGLTLFVRGAVVRNSGEAVAAELVEGFSDQVIAQEHFLVLAQ